jgi:serine protease Do
MFKAIWLSNVVLTIWGAAALAGSPAILGDSEFGMELVDGVITVAEPPEIAEYWLGIACVPVSPPWRAQLNLPEKQGLLVQGVAPDSPATKAGILQHDILLRAGDKPLSDPRDLVHAVDAAKEGKLKIELLRGGKPKTIEATPAKRPEDARRRAAGMPTPGDREAMEKWLQDMLSYGEAGGDGPRSPVQFRFIHPGAIVPRDVLVPAPLPPNMSIVVSKEGDQPAKIVVKRGDEKWEVTEKELDKLPADVRPHVERMLGGGLAGVVGTLPWMGARAEQLERMRQATELEKADSEKRLQELEKSLDVEKKRFDEMNRDWDKLRKEFEQQRGKQKPAEK